MMSCYPDSKNIEHRQEIIMLDKSEKAPSAKPNNTSTFDLQSITASDAKLAEAGYGIEKTNGIVQQDEAYDPFANRDRTHVTSDFGALVHIFKGSFGSGILSVPRAFKNSGLFFGLIGTVITGIVCAHCVSILVKCAHVLSVRVKRPSLGFEDTAEIAFKTGPKSIQKYATLAKHFVTCALFATYFLGNTVYVVLISETFKQLIDTNFHVDIDIRLYILLLSIPLIPLGIGRRLKYLVPISAFGAVFIIFGLSVTFYYALSDIPPITSVKYFTSLAEIPMFFATIVFAMEGIGTVLPVENSMANPDHFRGYFGVLSIAMTLIVSMYSIIGFVCYLKFGDNTAANVTLNLPHDILSEIVKLVVALSILFTYGLQFCVPSEIMWKRINPYVSTKNENLMYYLMRGSMIMGTVVVAVAIPKLGPFISLVGALCLATLGLFIPAVVETVTYWEEDQTHWRTTKNVIIMILSLFATVSGTYASIQDIIKLYSSHE